MNRKLKIFIKLVIFILSIIISIFLIMADFIIVLKYAGNYVVSININQNYVKEALQNEIGVDIPKDAEITKIEFKRVFDASEYKVTYLENGEEQTVRASRDADGIGLDQYMKQYGKTDDRKVLFVVGLIVFFQIVFPIICLLWLIKEIKKNKKENKDNEEK